MLIFHHQNVNVLSSLLNGYYEVIFDESYNYTELKQTVQNLGHYVIETFFCLEEEQKVEEGIKKWRKYVEEYDIPLCKRFFEAFDQRNKEKWFFQSFDDYPRFECTCSYGAKRDHSCEEVQCLKHNTPYGPDNCRGSPKHCKNIIKLKI